MGQITVHNNFLSAKGGVVMPNGACGFPDLLFCCFLHPGASTDSLCSQSFVPHSARSCHIGHQLDVLLDKHSIEVYDSYRASL